MDEELDEENISSDENAGEQSSNNSEGKYNPNKVKNTMDRARRLGKNAQNFGEKLGKVFTTLMKSKGKLILGVGILVAIIFLSVLWVAAEEDETEEAIDSIEEIVNTGEASATFTSFYEKTGSLLMITGDDVDKIYDSYMAEMKGKNNIKAKAFAKRYFFDRRYDKAIFTICINC